MQRFMLGLFLISIVLTTEEIVNEFTKANNLFAVTSYKETLKKNEGNFLVSPFSSEMVLAFIQSGSKGQTAQEIQTALNLPNDREKIENQAKSLLNQLNGTNSYQFHLVNKIYVQENFPLKEEFKKTAIEVYQAHVENINFIGDRMKIAEKINNWVESQTNNRIHNAINPNKLTNGTRVILLNSLYFKSEWSVHFSISNTEKKIFHRSVNNVTEVDTMHHSPDGRSYFNYYECSKLNAKFLKLPLQNEEASVVFVLPDEIEGLSNLENQIGKVLTSHNFTYHFVNVAIPKFKIETTIDFKEILKNLGVKRAFDINLADLSGIADVKGNLKIDDIMQKAFIDVNEAGVEASTVTYGASGLSSGAPSSPKQFIVDHPFLFYVNIKDVIAFVGRITDPKY